MDKFFDFVDQVFIITSTLLSAAEKIKSLAEISFTGVGADSVLKLLDGLNEEEWKADRIARSLSKDIYALEGQLDPITLLFSEKLLLSLSGIATEAENADDMLRTMIVK